MPKSRGRRKPPKKAKNTGGATPPAPPSPTRGSRRYGTGRIRSSMQEILGLVYNPDVPPDLMVELLPVMMWLENAVGYSTNRCAVACATLQHTYAAMGIASRPVAVDLVVANERTGERNYYGTPEPYWDGTTFHGHCVLSLPGSGRFVDPTVEQYPELRRYRLGPICGKLIAARVSSPEQLAALRPGGTGIAPGTHLGVRRNDLLLLYTTADEEFHDVVTAGAAVTDNQADFKRSGLVVAAQTLLLLSDPEVVDRARKCPHPHVRRLLDQFEGAELLEDDATDEPLIRLRGEADPRTLADLLQPPPEPAQARARHPRLTTATRPDEIPTPRELTPAAAQQPDSGPGAADGPEQPAAPPRGLLRRMRDALTGDPGP